MICDHFLLTSLIGTTKYFKDMVIYFGQVLKIKALNITLYYSLNIYVNSRDCLIDMSYYALAIPIER